MVQKKTTPKYDDVLILGSFFGGGVPKKSGFLAEILRKKATLS